MIRILRAKATSTRPIDSPINNPETETETETDTLNAISHRHVSRVEQSHHLYRLRNPVLCFSTPRLRSLEVSSIDDDPPSRPQRISSRSTIPYHAS